MDVRSIFHTLARLPEKLPWLDAVADAVQPLVHRFYRSGSGVNQALENLLHGVWLGHPLHPVITDITVGALTAGVALDAIEASTGDRRMGKGADAALALGAVTAVGAAAAGITDWQHTSGESRRTGTLHALFNTSALALFIASLAARGARNRSTGRGLALGGYALLFFGAFLGGDLVYRQKVGVRHSVLKEATGGYVPVMDAADLPERQLVRSAFEGVPVLLFRRGQEVSAIAEKCSHMGGPLSEGTLWDDDTVVCPWHGSRFELATGKVVDGPSTYNQATFQARIFNDRVEVRRQP